MNAEATSYGSIILQGELFLNIFIDKRQQDSIFQTATTTGIYAVKQTSNVFPLCYPKQLDNVDMIITMLGQDCAFLKYSADSVIYTDKQGTFYSDGMRCSEESQRENINEQPLDTTSAKSGSQINRINRAMQKFQSLQAEQIDMMKAKCKQAHSDGPQVLTIKTIVRAKGKNQPIIESMYATSVTLLSLYDSLHMLLKHNNASLTISQIQLES